MGMFFIVILIHPIYLWIKRISEKIWQLEKFFQGGLGCPVSPHPDSHRYLSPPRQVPLALAGKALVASLQPVVAPQGQGMEWGSSKSPC